MATIFGNGDRFFADSGTFGNYISANLSGSDLIPSGDTTSINMRFTYLDILEQCFHEKFRGYSKQEVDLFLQMVANDFKEMSDEIDLLKRDLEKNKTIITELELKLSSKQGTNDYPFIPKEFLPDSVRQKAENILQMAREKADLHLTKSEKELNRIKSEIQLLQDQKQDLLDNLKAGVKTYLKSLQKQYNGSKDQNG